MSSLTTPQATLLVAIIALAGGLIGWLGKGLAFALKRWWTGSSKHEAANYLNSLADLATKLRASGMTMSDVRELEAMMREPSTAASAGARQVIVETARTDEPEAFQNMMAMKVRTSAAFDVAEAKLVQALLDLQLLMEPHEQNAFELVQKRWRAYRDAMQEFSLTEYEGGSIAPLAAIFAALSETERRTAEILAQVAERRDR